VLLLPGGPIQARQPNVLFILVDDLGYMDIGANNPSTFYETPNVDSLASSGVRFTNGYAANPVCSPTRYSIMTGKYPSRTNATNFFSGARPGKFRPAVLYDRMDLEEVTVAECFQAAGYTTAFFGKWHLGPTEEYWPEHQGFDFNVGGFSRGAPPGGYFSPYKNPRLEDGPDGEHLTARLTSEVLETIEKVKNDPFFIYLSFYTVHTPLQAPSPLVEKYKAKARRFGLDQGDDFGPEEQVLPVEQARRVRVVQDHAVYAAMVETMDESIGKIVAKLEQLGLRDDTIICFTGDNGGLSTSEGSPTSNMPLRGGKGWLYEGGIREPFIISHPKSIAPRVDHTAVCSVDFYRTLLDLTRIRNGKRVVNDGVSLSDLLRDEKPIKERDLYWHYPHYSNQGGFPGGAIRRGNYKLVERFEDGSFHLFDLENDIGERKDIKGDHPQLVTSMRNSLHRWYREVDAQFLRAKENGPEPWHP
jgi:arylsulfatase A-like enzyme